MRNEYHNCQCSEADGEMKPGAIARGAMKLSAAVVGFEIK
jgi:hypothetical protein